MIQTNMSHSSSAVHALHGSAGHQEGSKGKRLSLRAMGASDLPLISWRVKTCQKAMKEVCFSGKGGWPAICKDLMSVRGRISCKLRVAHVLSCFMMQKTRNEHSSI